MKKAVLIMAGGRGERLWPLSIEKKPKQFLAIGTSSNGKTLIEQSIERAKLFTSEENIFIITGESFRDLFREYLQTFREENIIFEPTGRDTLAAITLGLYYIKQKIGDCSVAVLPSDPIIKDEDIFVNALNEAVNIADKTKQIATIGIKPTRPDTGYGYIKLSKLISTSSERIETFMVHGFKEKPTLERAKEFLSDGSYLWNSGMFIANADTILSMVEKETPDTYKKIAETFTAQKNNNKELALSTFGSLEKISFDYAIMEKLKEIYCVKGTFFWDDLGAFSALSRIENKDNNNNVSLGQSFLHDSRNNIIINENKTIIAISGLENITVVQSGDTTLIYPTGEDDRIKNILKAMREEEGNKKYL